MRNKIIRNQMQHLSISVHLVSGPTTGKPAKNCNRVRVFNPLIGPFRTLKMPLHQLVPHLDKGAVSSSTRKAASLTSIMTFRESAPTVMEFIDSFHFEAGCAFK